MPHHLRLDLHLVELLPRVDPNHTADHLWHDNHVSQVRLYEIGLLVRFGGLFGAAELFDEGHGAAFETAVETAAGAGVEESDEFFGVEVEESVW